MRHTQRNYASLLHFLQSNGSDSLTLYFLYLSLYHHSTTHRKYQLIRGSELPLQSLFKYYSVFLLLRRRVRQCSAGCCWSVLESTAVVLFLCVLLLRRLLCSGIRKRMWHVHNDDADAATWRLFNYTICS